MSVLPLQTTMACKWDSISPTQLGSYKMDRPAYSTPPPVENIPSNNECKMVELRGSKVASFSLGCEEYICLPQAFDLFLKHLVGGLHTVYTKLKRLSITPVVCNVEQVRILRGLGAIQPGVNRCKLITRKDFEILYQDCTTASRPGRPPKRYPVLPPTTDLMPHHASLRSNNTLLNQTELSNFQKRIRLDSTVHERRASDSPPKDNEKSHQGIPVPLSELHNSPTANLAYLQAFRHYQQQAAAAGIPNAIDPQQINPALAPFMMSYPLLSGIPQNSMAVLNHINQLAQSQAASGAMTTAAAAAAVAQLAASGGGKLNNHIDQTYGQDNCHSPNLDKESDGEEVLTPRNYGNAVGMVNGIGSDGRTSPTSSLGSMHEAGVGSISENNAHPHTFQNSYKTSHASKTSNSIPESVRTFSKSSNNGNASDDDMKSSDATVGSSSSMQSLLTNIQGLLKVAADSACLREKHSSSEIADLKTKLNQERQMREEAEQKLDHCEKEKAEAEKQLHQERSENKKLQDRLLSMQQLLGHHDINNNTNGCSDVDLNARLITSPSNRVSSKDALSEGSSPRATASSPNNNFPVTSSFESNLASSRMSAVVGSQQSAENKSPSISPASLTPTSSDQNLNSNNNNSSDDQKSPDFRKHPLITESCVAEIPLDLGRSRSEHATLQEQQRLYFKAPNMRFQPAASQ